MTPEEELGLVTESAKGDEDAFGDLVRFMAPALIRYLYSILGNLDSAEEVAQLSFLRAYQKIDRLRDPARFKAWLWRIARFAAFDRVRRERRRGPEPDSLDSIGIESGIPDYSVPEHLTARYDLIEKTRSAINRLPTENVEVLVLRYEEELTYQQMADRLDLTLFQVKARLARARSQLRPRLSELADEWKQFCDETS